MYSFTNSDMCARGMPSINGQLNWQCVSTGYPMVYVLRRETARACELACDEAVVRVLGDGQRRIYGSVLLDTLGRSMMYAGTADRPVMTLSLGENAKWMKERLGDIMDRSKRRKRHLYASLH